MLFDCHADSNAINISLSIDYERTSRWLNKLKNVGYLKINEINLIFGLPTKSPESEVENII